MLGEKMISTTEITKKTEQLLKENGLWSVSVQVDRLAKKLGITVLEKDLEDSLSGFLVVKNGVSTVVINKHHHSNRQRFTLAHEIGHWMLHADIEKEALFLEKKQIYNRNILSGAGSDLQEIEANRFAASLLMPETLVKESLNKEKEFIFDFNGDSSTIEFLANQFGVSQIAFTHRLSSLLIQPNC